MHWLCGIFLLTYMVTVAIPISLAFNIDTTAPEVYRGKPEDFFGYKVLQFRTDTNKGIMVTAPLQHNGSGGICKPEYEKEAQCFSAREISHEDTQIPVKHLGLSLAKDSSSRFTVCSPSLAHECDENVYLNSVCYKMTDELRGISSFLPDFQECTKKTVDLVFLFDGSGSMTEAEFNKNKVFIVDIMNSLKNTTVKFAAVQFSYDYNKVFDFSDYQAGLARHKLRKEKHMKSLTNTHKALKFVLEEIFDNPEAGASPDATKVLVLITDGDPSDEDDTQIIQKYENKTIIRIVIGVKNVKLEKLEPIASEPKEKNIFQIEQYSGLAGILGNFQKKIFSMEGIDGARAGEMTNEMSQSGFSAVFYEDTLILGSVGSNTLRGSLLELHRSKEIQIQDEQMKNDSYMGYSTAVGKKNNNPLYFAGAPRFEHTGRVVLFRHNGKNWIPAQRLNGDQIGSYFGAEVCSVDINSDENTDFLLVGAPLFYQPQEKREGQIFVYKLTDEMQLKIELNVSVPSLGRFGTAISSLADLNGDGLRDVAVGAPLEDDKRGAVYIFLGDKHSGIRSTFSQRILGKKIEHELRLFGQAIDGGIDLGEDELPDIVVGSRGMAVVLRSRPVFNVIAHFSFQPEEISTDKIDCRANTEGSLPMVTLTTCFEKMEATKSKAGTIHSGLNISYTLDVDPMRPTSRGFFSQTDKKSRNFTESYELTDDKTCFNHSIYMLKCVTDTLSPISIRLNFSQSDSEDTDAVLNIDSKRQAVVEVPFERQCRQNDTCIAELEVDFNCTNSTLLVTEENFFNLTVKLSNHGDDSYNTSLSMHYPPGLSFSWMTLIEATRPTLYSCNDEGDIDKTVCGISRPVYRARSSATFKTSFRVISDYEWNDTVALTITGQSDNTNSTRTNSMTKRVQVQFEIQMAVAVKEDSVTYLNFTAEDAAPKKLVTTYKINNPGFKAFPINVSLFFPTTLEHDFEMKNYQVFVQESKSNCTSITETKSEYCSPEKDCKRITCDTFILDKESATEVTLLGDVHFRDLRERAANIGFLKRYIGESAEVKFKSFIHVGYDTRRYVLASNKQQQNEDGLKRENAADAGLWRDNDPRMKSTEVQVEFIIPMDERLIILTGVGLGFLLLVIITVIAFKMGCFKRKRPQDFEEEEEAALQDGNDTNVNPAPIYGNTGKSETDGKADEPPEEESLLEPADVAILPTDPQCSQDPPSYEDWLADQSS